MKKILNKYGLKLLGALVGAVGGYAYYHFVGCASGTCPISSNPYVSTAYGALLGYLLFDIIKVKRHEEQN